MLEISYHRRFKKNFNRLPKRIRELTLEKSDLFLADPHHPTLRTHKLGGVQKELWAFSINREYRVLVNFVDATTVLFHDIGTHDEVYE